MSDQNRSNAVEALSPSEERMLKVTLERGETLRCPRCRTLLATQEIAPRSDVSYVRHRIVVVCGGCGVHGALDLPHSQDRPRSIET